MPANDTPNKPPVAPSANTLVRGKFDLTRGDLIHGWIIGSGIDIRPLVYVNNEPAVLVDPNIFRPDVCNHFGIKSPYNIGFACRLPAVATDAILTLYGVTPQGVQLVDIKKLSHPVGEKSLIAQVAKAARIAAQEKAVCITCWDGSGNAICRAKELYDTVAIHRPVVLICYTHEESGDQIWPPLQRWGGNLIAIPWSQRHMGHKLLRQYGLYFDTVWICKPRLPSFMLARAVSHEHTRQILDRDDEDITFAGSQEALHTAYGAAGQSLARFLSSQVRAITVSSNYLQQTCGGQLVRHVRTPMKSLQPDGNAVFNIGFIGTAKATKNLAALARILRLLAADGHKMQLHIFGTVEPDQKEALEKAGAILHGMIPFVSLEGTLASLHALVCGFSPAARDKTGLGDGQYHVPPLISDALACGKPVLVPLSAAVNELQNLPGVHVFDENNLHEKLKSALEEKIAISLPPDFTPQGAFEQFAKAESLAENTSLPLSVPGLDDTFPQGPAVVLLWKQPDSAMYGRRVDQIARSCKQKYPNHRVYVLEFYDELPEIQAVAELHKENVILPGPDPFMSGEDFHDENNIRKVLIARKKHGLQMDGIYHKTIGHHSIAHLRESLTEFLVHENLTANNTLFVLFPVINLLEEGEDILRPYARIADVVDNELGWAKDNPRRARLMDQYYRVMRGARHIVFNSHQNRDFFAKLKFLDLARASVIANWYELPSGVSPKISPLAGKVRHIFYSGNMNDRIDWNLMHKIVDLPDVCLHLAGTCQREINKLDALIEAGAIYHGVTGERETLAMLEYMDAAIIAHVLDDLSRFMNPIKAGMYRACGVPVICPANINLDQDGIMLYETPGQCLAIIKNLPKRKNCPAPLSSSTQAEDYCQLIARFHPVNVTS